MNKVLVLDHIDGIKLDLENTPFPNMHAIHYLPIGIKALASTVKNEETKVLNYYKELNMEPPIFSMGEAVANMGLVICSFHWFSVSLINYLRLVALVDISLKNNWSSSDVQKKENRKLIKQSCNAYIEKVSPLISIWRNKVGAHLAITAPYDSDNLGTLEYSGMNTISFSKYRFVTSDIDWVSNNEKSELPKWSLTDEFNEISKRLWPL